MTGVDGRQVALDGDLCVCRCQVAPHLIASYPNAYQGFEAPEIAGTPSAAEWLGRSGLNLPAPSSTEEYGKVFQFKDSVTGELLCDRTLLVDEGGTIRIAKTDGNGQATIQATGGLIKIHLVFESSIGPMKYEV